ncbi:MAG: PQQ-binding-like beta-propeller repeat protein [Myxococcota bacterium]
MRWALAMMLVTALGCGKDAGSPWDMALGGGTEREVEVAFGEGRAAVLVDGKALTVVDEASGSVLWRDDLAAAVPRAPAWVAAQSGWLTVDADGVATLRDGKNGTERWRLETGKHGFGPVLVDGSRAYFGAGRELVALDLDARGVAWARALSERWPVSARPTLDGHHLYMEVGEDIVAIEAATGAVAWRHSTSSYAGRAWSRPVAVAGGKVLAGTTTKAFVALAEGDGKALWSATPGPRTFSDVVDAAALVAGDRVLGLRRHHPPHRGARRTVERQRAAPGMCQTRRRRYRVDPGFATLALPRPGRRRAAARRRSPVGRRGRRAARLRRVRRRARDARDGRRGRGRSAAGGGVGGGGLPRRRHATLPRAVALIAARGGRPSGGRALGGARVDEAR